LTPCPDRLCPPPLSSILSYTYRGFFSGQSGRSVKLTTHLNLVSKSKYARSYTSTPPIQLHGVVLGWAQIEAIGSTTTLVNTSNITWCIYPEVQHLNIDHQENLKSQSSLYFIEYSWYWKTFQIKVEC